MARVERWQRRFAAEPGAHGLPFVYLSDEWYYTTKQPFPPARHYGGYAQIENGVGMTRKLLDDWRGARRELPRGAARAAPVGAGDQRRWRRRVHGSASPRICSRVAGLDVRSRAVENSSLGRRRRSRVCSAARMCWTPSREPAPTSVPTIWRCSPRVMLDNAGTRFLDDMTIEEFAPRGLRRAWSSRRPRRRWWRRWGRWHPRQQPGQLGVGPGVAPYGACATGFALVARRGESCRA